MEFNNKLKPKERFWDEPEYKGYKGKVADEYARQDWDGFATMLEAMDKQGYPKDDPKRLMILEKFGQAYDYIQNRRKQQGNIKSGLKNGI